MSNASQANNQNQIKKENVKMTNKAVGFQLVNSKEVVVVSDHSKKAFPVQVAMDLCVGDKVQHVTFGYSRLGGRKTYLVADDKAPVAMNRASFIQRLRAYNVLNMRQVENYLNQLKYFNRDEFIVSKCEHCESGYVTAANIDYVQRNYEKLTEKLGFAVSEHSKLCYTCQGVQTKIPAETQVKVPATSEHACCSNCGAVIKSQKVVEYSLRTYGRILCFKPCQSKFPKLTNRQTNAPRQNASAPIQGSVPVSKPKASAKETLFDRVFTCGFLNELMALEVDPYSEIAKAQELLANIIRKERKHANILWNQKHEIDLERGASAASATIPDSTSGEKELSQSEKSTDDLCLVCDGVLPSIDVWNGDTCPSCVLDNSDLASQDVIMAARQFLNRLDGGASEASTLSQSEVSSALVGEAPAEPLSQAEVKGEDALKHEDTKEVPHAETSEESVCKIPEPAKSTSTSHPDDVAKFMDMITESINQDGVLPKVDSTDGLVYDVLPF